MLDLLLQRKSVNRMPQSSKLGYIILKLIKLRYRKANFQCHISITKSFKDQTLLRIEEGLRIVSIKYCQHGVH